CRYGGPPMRLTVFQKGLALAIVPLLFQLVFVFVLVWVQRDSVAAGRLATHTKDVISQAYEIQVLVADGDAGVRGYVISEKSEFADPYRNAAHALPGRLNELQLMVDDNSNQTKKVHTVRT